MNLQSTAYESDAARLVREARVPGAPESREEMRVRTNDGTDRHQLNRGPDGESLIGCWGDEIRPLQVDLDAARDRANAKRVEAGLPLMEQDVIPPKDIYGNQPGVTIQQDPSILRGQRSATDPSFLRRPPVRRCAPCNSGQNTTAMATSPNRAICPSQPNPSWLTELWPAMVSAPAKPPAHSKRPRMSLEDMQTQRKVTHAMLESGEIELVYSQNEREGRAYEDYEAQAKAQEQRIYEDYEAEAKAQEPSTKNAHNECQEYEDYKAQAEAQDSAPTGRPFPEHLDSCTLCAEPSTKNAQGEYVNPGYTAELAEDDAWRVQDAAESAKTKQRAQLAAEAQADHMTRFTDNAEEATKAIQRTAAAKTGQRAEAFKNAAQLPILQYRAQLAAEAAEDAQLPILQYRAQLAAEAAEDAAKAIQRTAALEDAKTKQRAQLAAEVAVEAAKTRQRVEREDQEHRSRKKTLLEVAAEAAETKQRDAHNARSRNKSLPRWPLTKEIIRARADKIIAEGCPGHNYCSSSACTETVGDIEDLIDAVMTSIMDEAEEKQLRVVDLKLGDVKSVMKDLWNERQANTMPVGNHTVEEMIDFLMGGDGDEPGQAAALSDEDTIEKMKSKNII